MKIEELCINDVCDFADKYKHRKSNNNSCDALVIKQDKNSVLSYCASSYNRAVIGGHQYIILRLRTSLRDGCERQYIAIEIQFSEWLKKKVKDMKYKTINYESQGELKLS